MAFRGDRKIQTQGPTVLEGIEACQVFNLYKRWFQGWDFLPPMNTNDPVCEVKLCIRHFPMWYPESGMVLDCIDS